VGSSEDDAADLERSAGGNSLLGKFDFKSLLAKKDKGAGARQAASAE
jgi:hypothetical protein